MLSPEFELFLANMNALYPLVRLTAKAKPRGGVSVYLSGGAEIATNEVLGFDCGSESDARTVIYCLVKAGESKALNEMRDLV